MLASSNISVMVLLIVSGAVTFSQILAFTGATSDMVDAVLSLDVSPSVIVFLMIMVVVLMGMFMGPLPIMLITLPIFVPVVIQFGFSPIWFAAMFLVAIETGATSPPFGAALFVMKAVAPEGTTMAGHLPRRGAVHHLRPRRDPDPVLLPCPGDRAGRLDVQLRPAK